MSNDLHTLSGAYAIDALSSEEAEEFKKHLESCSACRDEVRELQEAAAQMGASEAIDPPAWLKARVLAAAARQPQLPPKVSRPRSGRMGRWAPSRWTPGLVAAAAAVVLVVAAGVGIAVDRGLQEPQPMMSASVARVFHAGDAHTATMRTSNGGRISVATSASLREMAVDGGRLPTLGTGQVYQLWAIAHGKPHSAGLLADPGKGAAMAMPPAGVKVAITIEPSGGSPQPTRRPIMSVVPAQV